MSKVGCCVADCWYSRNYDRINEFNGLHKVVVNNKSCLIDKSIQDVYDDGDVIGICDVCFESDGNCDVCGRSFIGINEIHKSVCMNCIDCDDVYALLVKNKEKIYKISLDFLYKNNHVISKDTYVHRSLRGKKIREIKRENDCDIMKKIGLEINEEIGFGELIELTEEYDGLVSLICSSIKHDIFKTTKISYDKKNCEKKEKKRKRDHQQYEYFKEWIPSLSENTYKKIKTRIGMKSDLKKFETVEDMFIHIAKNSSLKNKYDLFD